METAKFSFDGFACRDIAVVHEKLRRFSVAGTEKLHFVFDFDHTLTAGRKYGENVGTWDVLDELLPAQGRAEHNEIYRRYRPRELYGSLTEQEAVKWWTEVLSLLVTYEVNMLDADKAFLEAVRLRQGAAGLFEWCKHKGVPTVILSAGIKDVIVLLAKKYEIEPTLILSTELEIGKVGKVAGWKAGSLLHNFNKHEAGHPELTRIRAERPNVILVGNAPNDAQMAEGEDEVLRVCVMDLRKDEVVTKEAFLRESFQAGFDLVLAGSLQPLLKIMEKI